MYSHSYLQFAVNILNKYDGSVPFSVFLKEYFKNQKKHGARDRKQIAHLCYCYFRLGKALMQVDIENQIVYGLFLCSAASNKLLEGLDAELNKLAIKGFNEKSKHLLEKGFIPGEVFPFEEELSSEIDHTLFSESFFFQPELFLRIRPGHDQSVIQKLSSAEIPFKRINEECLALPNSSKVESILELDKEAVVQDYNSQRVLDLLPIVNCSLPIFSVWDCCAASGGKSILLYDKFPQAQLTVSDVRKNILHNLQKRFAKAGIKNYKSVVADVSNSSLTPDSYRDPHSPFDLIICDAPCTGSGTWSRTPEQLYFFKKERIVHYATLQKKIAVNASKSLKPGGYFIYITCSVFRKENEEVVEFLQQETKMKLESMQYLKGYDKKADALFVALFRL